MRKIGLTDEEVVQSRNDHGSNAMTEQHSESFWDKLKDNLGDPMIKILIVALLINIVLAVLGIVGVIPAESAPKWFEPLGIFVAIALATLVSTFSEYRNENAFQKLQEEASRIMCKVYRNGVIAEVAIDDLVVGDAVLLQSGDKIPADGILIDGDIKVDQSVLNGESREAKKEAIPEDWTDTDENTNFDNEHKVFRGAVVCSGNAVMQVTVVGDKSVYGKIAGELQTDEDRETPLKLKLGNLANGISKFGYIGGIAIAAAIILKGIFITPEGGVAAFFAAGDWWLSLLNLVVEAVMMAVIIIVMAVPEGLPLMIAIVSAQNMGKMLKDNVLVRKVAGIETAGSLNILFSDKTGTITKGRLEAVTFFSGNCTEYKNIRELPTELEKLLSVSIQHNTLSVISGEGPDRKVIGGNATERAILEFDIDSSKDTHIVEAGSIPFNSTNKYSATQITGSYNMTLIKGAPEKILQRCKYYYSSTGEKKPFDMLELNAKIDYLADRAIRVLAFATSDDPLNGDALPNGDNWTLVGIIGIRDEVRPESVTAIEEVKGAGVQVVMITGDRKETAVAIAKDAGLLEKDTDVVLTSDELTKLSDDDLKKLLPDIRVISRALPSDKSRLVRVAQELNLVVGMTGDGVNDSPALKKADVGFAMGGGTEVAKEASDIVILDDNFSSIDKAILYGRTIFNSIRKFIIFQLTINVAAVLISFICPLLSIESPLGVIQILWVNLVMDTLAALAFGGEPALPRFMKEKPKRRDEAIISKNMMTEIIVGAGWTFVVSLALLLLGTLPANSTEPGVSILEHLGWIRESNILGEPHAYLHTVYFAFFIFIAVFNGFNARTEKCNLFDNIKGNKGFLITFGIIAVVQVIMTYLGGEILGGYGLTLAEWLVVLIPAISIIPIDLIRKAITKITTK